jgi:hypothetical protein
VMTEAQRMADGGETRARKPESVPFPAEELRGYVESNAAIIRATARADFLPVAESLDQIGMELPLLSADLEALEQRLTVLEQKLIAIARSAQSEQQALEARQNLEKHLRPWRGKMTAPQIAMLETQFLDRATLDSAGLPRLSLFYLK